MTALELISQLNPLGGAEERGHRRVDGRWTTTHLEPSSDVSRAPSSPSSSKIKFFHFPLLHLSTRTSPTKKPYQARSIWPKMTTTTTRVKTSKRVKRSMRMALALVMARTANRTRTACARSHDVGRRTKGDMKKSMRRLTFAEGDLECYI